MASRCHIFCNNEAYSYAISDISFSIGIGAVSTSLTTNKRKKNLQNLPSLVKKSCYSPIYGTL